MPAPRRDLPPLGLLAAAAFLLRLVHLTRFELWVDEAATWHFARLAASGRVLEGIALEPTPPFYYALVGVVMRLFGESDLVMRLPSAVFGAAAVPAVFLLGRELWSRRAGWIAAAIVAVHPFHVFYSREARVYPLLLDLALLVWFFLWRGLERDRVRDWAAFAAVLLVACYSHFFGLFLGAGAGLLVLAFGRTWTTRLRGLAAAAVAGLLFLPYVVATLPHIGESGAAWSVERFYEELPGEKRLGRSLEMSFVGARYNRFLRQIDRPPTPPLVRWTCLLVQVALLVLAAAAARRGPPRGRQLAFLLAAWVLPVLVPWSVNHVHTFFQTGRHDVYVLGTFCVLLGAGLDELWGRSRTLALVAAAVLVLGAGQRLAALHRLPAGEHHRMAGRWIAEHAADGDRVVAMGIRRLVTEHYARLAGSGVDFESFPRSTDAHPGWSDDRALLDDEPALFREGRERALTLPAGGTLFVLLRPYQRGTEMSMVSSTWLVDRHLLQNLHDAGWQRMEALWNPDLDIAAFRPPPAVE